MFKQNINAIINDYVRSNLQKIEPLAGQCRYNYHCHSNTVHEAITLMQDEIALVVYFDDGCPIVHFINYSKVYTSLEDQATFNPALRKEQYKDNTLGVWCERYEYYLVRIIKKSEFWDVYSIHESYRKHLHRLLPFWLRLFDNPKNR